MDKNNSFFFEETAKTYTAGKGITRQFIGYNNSIMMVKVMFEKDAVGTAHTHPHTQTSYINSGKFEVTINGETNTLQAGDGFFVEPNVLHGCVCIEEGAIIDVFAPCREDFLQTIE
ncbi:cupin domain-containing protein [Bacteroides sp. 519]|uniref:cupin domain-containing protein n=1 Tax=Bacteroides sp. 519 TaxID=2302937 RepID=UPI0013D8181A|nr:cupin domain-containing protein [Bacteroides sp. 519]NDV57338.1 cupin domain-containing protein [Bacteroides sp. 519]